LVRARLFLLPLVALFPIPVEAAAARVVINEVHYHPADDLRDGEFIELYNFGSEPADLSRWSLVGGVELTLPQGTILLSNSFLVLAADKAALQARYSLDPRTLVGDWTGSLSNDKAKLELWTAGGYLMSFIDYGDADPWPELPDGLGPSLERISPAREEADAGAWAPSIPVGGTPGAPNSVRVEDPAPPGGSSVQLVAPGAAWRFFRGRSEPPAAWIEPPFDDAGWETGNAGFGYDDGDDATVLSDMQGGYSTFFIRRAFQVADPTRIESLELNVIHDDGYVAYLNGVEVDRANVPGAPGTRVPFDAVAPDSVEPPVQRSADIGSFRGLLVPGLNVLAVEGANVTLNNRDFSLHPSLTASLKPAPSHPATYVESGAAWSFLRGTQAPPSDWREVSFVDDAWESGPAGFGFGDGDDATILVDMAGNYLTVFIRKRFPVADAAKVTSLKLTVNYDDGFIAYLNGVEVARSNVSTPGFSTPADAGHEAGSPEDFPIANPSNVLRTGVNVLAIEGHNATLASGDFSLAPSLSGVEEGDNGAPPPGPPPARPPRDVVINELFLSGDGTGWVELYNTSSQPRDLGGRRLGAFPAAGGFHPFAPGTSIAAKGYLVLGEAELGFPLPLGLPVLILSTADNLYLDALNPRTAPSGRTSGRWPDGSEDRYVLASPTPGAPNVLSLEDRVVINEIQYHPAPANAGGEFIELHNRSGESVDISAWSFTRGIDYAMPPGTVMPPGGYLVVARDPRAAASYYGIPLPLGPYVGQLKNDAETLLLRDAVKNLADRVRYADDGSWPPAADGTGPSLELVHPFLENRYGPAWAASAGEGTPGAANSKRVADPPPILAGVEHSPAVPTPGQPVLVTAVVADDKPIVSVNLLWQVDGAGGNPAQVAMADDGVGDDGIPGNGIFGATLPARPDRTIVLFWIRATAQGNQSVTVPAGAPNPAFLYQVEAPGAEGARPLYRMVLKASDLQSLRARGNTSNVLLDSTFIADGKSYYNRGLRYRGSSARHCDPLSYRVQFDHDTDFHGIKRLDLNGCNTQRQWIGLDFLSRTGIATPQAWFRKLSLNGVFEPGIHLRVEAIDDQFLERVFPDADQGGNLYRGVNRANLDYRGQDFAPYQGDYEKHTNEEAADWSDIVDLCFRFDADTTSEADFPAAIEAVVDIDEWALYFAAFAILGSTENSILLNNGDDYYLYRRPSDGKWILLPWDLDSCFDETEQVLFRPTVAQIERFLEHPRYAPLYWCYLESLLPSAFPSEVVEARVDQLAPLFSASLVTQLREFAPARRSYISPRLSPALTVAAATGGRICGDQLEASASTVALEGLAPGCGTTEVRLNGARATYDPQTARWSAGANVASGETLSILALDRNGAEVARRELTVSTSASTALPLSLSASLTLRASQSPYRAAGTVTVQPGVTLSVEPGVTVLLDVHSALIVEGRLLAAGSSDQPIRFAAENCSAGQEGLVFRGGGPESRLTYCEFRGLGQAPGYAAGIAIDGAAVAMDRVAITGRDGSGSAGAGVALEVRGRGSLSLKSSLVAKAGTALSLSGGSSGDLGGSLFRDNAIALMVTGGASLTAEHLTVFHSSTSFDLRESAPGSGSGALIAHSLIVWDTPVLVAADGGSTWAVTFSNVSGPGLTAGEGNIDAEPRFIDPALGDFRLSYFSPSRGTGKDGTDMGAFPYEPTGEASPFLRCDANADGENDLADAIKTLLALFAGGSPAACAPASDCDGSGVLNVSDVIFDLEFLFTGAQPPPSPYPGCDQAPVESCGVESCVR
jgi:hypothetical protein